MSENEYYLIEFRFNKTICFSIWCSEERDETFLTRYDGILIAFSSKNNAYKYCDLNDFTIESEVLYDFNTIDYKNTNDFLNKWNIISDLAKTLQFDFIGDSNEFNELYKKFLCGCNLPTMNEHTEQYTPIFSSEDKTQIINLIIGMRETLEKALRWTQWDL